MLWLMQCNNVSSVHHLSAQFLSPPAGSAGVPEQAADCQHGVYPDVCHGPTHGRRHSQNGAPGDAPGEQEEQNCGQQVEEEVGHDAYLLRKGLRNQGGRRVDHIVVEGRMDVRFLIVVGDGVFKGPFFIHRQCILEKLPRLPGIQESLPGRSNSS